MTDPDLLKARAHPAQWLPERAALAASLAHKHWPDQAIADKLNEKYAMDVTAHEVRLKLNALEKSREDARKRKRGRW